MANVFVQIIASKKVRLKITQNLFKKIFFTTETQRHNASLQFRKFKRFPRLYIADSKDYVVNIDPSKSQVLRVFRPLGQLD